MGIPEKLDSARIVYVHLDSGGLDAWNLDAWSWENWTLGLCSLRPKKLKLNSTVKGAVADYDIFNIRFSFSKKRKHSC